MDPDVSDRVCRDSWNAIATKDVRRWTGLPHACGYAELEARFPRLRDEYGLGRLGSAQAPAMFRVHVAEAYPDGLRAWFREQHLVLIEIELPELADPLDVLARELGEPARKLDYQLDVMLVREGAWIYPERGLTLFLDVGRTVVMRLGLYHPAGIEEYLESVHPDVRVEERPFRG